MRSKKRSHWFATSDALGYRQLPLPFNSLADSPPEDSSVESGEAIAANRSRVAFGRMIDRCLAAGLLTTADRLVAHGQSTS